MKKILKYFAVIENDKDFFNKHVEDLMKDDPRWQPFGGIAASISDHYTRYAQAFVIYEN